MAEIKANVPNYIKIQNTSNANGETGISIGFVPYRENFVSVLKAGLTLEFKVKNSGDVLYYLQQQTRGLEVTQIDALDAPTAQIVVIDIPDSTGNVMTLTNIGDKVVSFTPYKENFMQEIPVGDNVQVSAKTVGQVLYYLAQGIEGKLSVAITAYDPE